jgi:hypothetical protein
MGPGDAAAAALHAAFEAAPFVSRAPLEPGMRRRYPGTPRDYSRLID